MHQRKVAILNAGLHAVAAHHQIKIVGGVLHAGVLLPVVLFKGQCAVTGLHRADDRDQALGIAARNVADRAVQPQQIVRRGVQQFRNAGHGGGVGGGLAAFPLADSLLGDPQSGGKLRLADALLFAALLQ